MYLHWLWRLRLSDTYHFIEVFIKEKADSFVLAGAKSIVAFLILAMISLSGSFHTSGRLWKQSDLELYDFRLAILSVARISCGEQVIWPVLYLMNS